MRQVTAQLQQAQPAVTEVKQRYKSRLTALADQVAATDKQAKVQEGLYTAAVKHSEALEALLAQTYVRCLDLRQTVLCECFVPQRLLLTASVPCHNPAACCLAA